MFHEFCWKQEANTKVNATSCRFEVLQSSISPVILRSYGESFHGLPGIQEPWIGLPNPRLDQETITRKSAHDHQIVNQARHDSELQAIPPTKGEFVKTASEAIRVMKVSGKWATPVHGTVLFLCVLCSGCASNEVYPDDWPAPAPISVDCPDISGIYYDWGEEAEDESPHLDETKARLSEYLFRERYGWSDVIVIAQPDNDKIVIDGFYEDSIVRSRTLSRDEDDYSCEEGKIWVSGSPRFELSLLASGVEKNRIGLAKSMDDSLIGEFRAIQSGAWLMAPVPVPFVASVKEYFLWASTEIGEPTD